MTTLDNSGAMIPLKTRAGIDFVFELGVDDASGNPVDLTGYLVDAELDDDRDVHDLAAEVEADTIRVHIPAELTEVLPGVSRYSVEIVSPDNIRSSLAYGTVSCDRGFP